MLYLCNSASYVAHAVAPKNFFCSQRCIVRICANGHKSAAYFTRSGGANCCNLAVFETGGRQVFHYLLGSYGGFGTAK